MNNTTHIHPRLQSQREKIGTALALDDPTELSAALEDIQVLLDRCGYHLRFQRAGRELKRKPKAERLAQANAPAATPRRGRPKGSANWAERQLALGLAEIWRTHTGRSPTRRYNAFTEHDYGPYFDFVDLVRCLLPSPLQRTRKGHAPTVDYLVRIGIEEFKDAKRSSSEARQRGLLEHHRWDGRASQN